MPKYYSMMKGKDNRVELKTGSRIPYKIDRDEERFSDNEVPDWPAAAIKMLEHKRENGIAVELWTCSFSWCCVGVLLGSGRSVSILVVL